MLAEQEWLVHGEVTTAGVARVWVAPERARWLREERTVVEELSDGAVVVELPTAPSDWLAREVLKGVGDLVVLEPTRRARPCSRRSPAERPAARGGAGASRDRAAGRPEPGADDARGHQHLRGRGRSRAWVIDPGPATPATWLGCARRRRPRRDRRRPAHPRPRRPHRRGRGARRRAALGPGELDRRGGGAQAALVAGSASALEPAARPPAPRRGDRRPVHDRADARPRRRPRLLRVRRGLLLRRPDPRQRLDDRPAGGSGGSLADYMHSLRAGRRRSEPTCSPRATARGSPTRRPRSPSTSSTGASASGACSRHSNAGERSRAALLAEVWDDVPEVAAPRGGDRDAGAPREARGRGLTRPGRAG